jgi:hypothetical protein
MSNDFLGFPAAFKEINAFTKDSVSWQQSPPIEFQTQMHAHIKK